MQHGVFKRRPIPVEQAVEKIKARLRRARDAVGAASTGGKYMEAAGADEDQHDAEPEVRHADAEKAEARADIVDPGIRPRAGPDSERDRERERDQNREESELAGGGEALGDHFFHRPGEAERF